MKPSLAFAFAFLASVRSNSDEGEASLVYLALITSLVPESCCCLFCRVAYIKLNNLCTSVELQSVCSEGRRSSETKRLAMHIDLILHSKCACV